MVPVDTASHWMCLNGGGRVKVQFCLGTANNVISTEDIEYSVVTLTGKAHHPKYNHLSFNQWALAHKQLHASLYEWTLYLLLCYLLSCYLFLLSQFLIPTYSLVDKHYVVGNDPGTYSHSNIFDHDLLLLTIISMINELGGETSSPYLSLCSMDAICSKNMLWVLAIIEEYMIIEYVKLLLRLCWR